jgi:hypothetical protein
MGAVIGAGRLMGLTPEQHQPAFAINSRRRRRSGCDTMAAWGCPLWVISGHFAVQLPCPLYPRKRTCALQRGMSALCQKRTHAAHQTATSFDNLVGAGRGIVKRSRNRFILTVTADRRCVSSDWLDHICYST